MILNICCIKEKKVRMNKVIIYGKIITKVEFKFIYDRFKNDNTDNEKYKHISVAKCKIKLLNESILEVYGYDKMADYMYRNLKEKDKVCLIGRLNSERKYGDKRMFQNLKICIYVLKKFKKCHKICNRRSEKMGSVPNFSNGG